MPQIGFVLSLFDHRDLPASHSLATDHWPLATIRSPRQRGQVVRRPSPAGYCHTDHRIGKDRTGPDLDERRLYFSMRQARCFLPTNQLIPPHLPPPNR